MPLRPLEQTLGIRGSVVGRLFVNQTRFSHVGRAGSIIVNARVKHQECAFGAASSRLELRCTGPKAGPLLEQRGALVGMMMASAHPPRLERPLAGEEQLCDEQCRTPSEREANQEPVAEGGVPPHQEGQASTGGSSTL